MGSDDESASKVPRKTFKIKAKQPEVGSLKNLGNKLKKKQHLTFARRYGNVLDLLDVKVQEGALTALAQFYDPPLRCFTFRDFQLAPTIEEFEQILGYPLKNGKPYLHLGHNPSLPRVAETLKVHARELEGRKQSKGGKDGFSREYLEKQALCLAESGDWDTFMDVLALIIYGIVLFPNIDDFVDFTAIDVFLAFKHRKENPVPAVLADVYYTLHRRHKKKSGVMLCCLPVLYVWLINHMFRSGHRVEAKSNPEWARALTNLNANSILWYSRDQGIEEVICQCGDYPNVPLMGTKGCINYNPALALRQLGYPILGPPTEKMTSAFIVHGLGPENHEELRRVRQAWDRVIKKGRELGRRCHDASESYHRWVKERVSIIKLPFRSTTPIVEEIPMQDSVSIEEVEEMRAALIKKDKELEEARQAYKTLQQENTRKTLSLERANKKARIEEECKRRTQVYLKAANEGLKLRGIERDMVLAEKQQLKEQLAKSQMAEKSVQRQLEDLKQQLEGVVVEYKRRARNESQKLERMTVELKRVEAEKQEKEEHITSYQAYTSELKNYIEAQEVTVEELKQEGVCWVYRFARKMQEANQTIENFLEHLGKAEGMANPLSTPVEIYKFFKYCKDLTEELKKVTGWKN